MANHIWTMTLAGGAGRRLSGVTGGVPKQFWRMNGRTTLLDDTLDRLSGLAPRWRTIIVVNRVHEPYLAGAANVGGHIVYQPEDRGTAAAVLLALLPILDVDPAALVVVSPADHGVARPERLRRSLLEAFRHVRARRADIVLFGVEPDRIDESYGWITAGTSVGRTGLRAVESFVEKPDAAQAAALFESGAVWNTMLLAARASALLDLFVARQPDWTRAFTEAWWASTDGRSRPLAEAYARLPRRDFSHDVLSGASGLAVHTLPASLGWTDLGTPERLHAWLDRRPVSAATPERAISAAS